MARTQACGESAEVHAARFPLRLPLWVDSFWGMADMHMFPAALAPLPEAPVSDAPVSAALNIGSTIRGYRQQKGMSQGDVEKRTGLLRCYLSRVENGHTVPSLDTLQKIAGALSLPLSQFFADDVVSREMASMSLTEDEIRFLTQIQRYSAHLTDGDRRLLLAMVRKFAQSANA